MTAGAPRRAAPVLRRKPSMPSRSAAESGVGHERRRDGGDSSGPPTLSASCSGRLARPRRPTCVPLVSSASVTASAADLSQRPSSQRTLSRPVALRKCLRASNSDLTLPIPPCCAARRQVSCGNSDLILCKRSARDVCRSLGARNPAPRSRASDRVRLAASARRCQSSFQNFSTWEKHSASSRLPRSVKSGITSTGSPPNVLYFHSSASKWRFDARSIACVHSSSTSSY